jgi:hypothetical protein
VREAQERERLRLAEAPLLSSLGGEPAELDQARLLGGQLQAELRKSVAKLGEEPLGVIPVLEADDVVVGVFGALAAPVPDQQPQHGREGEIGERKEHAPILSSPDAKGSKSERLGLGRQPLGCKAQQDLVSARAHEPMNGASERRSQGRQSNH